MIRVLPGVYRLTEPLWIRDKRLLTLVGTGSDGANRTELLGPLLSARDAVADPELARGIVNIIDSSIEMSHVLLRGFDAGIVGRRTDTARRADRTNRFRNIAIRDTGRGILWKSGGKFDVSDSKISDVA